MNAFMMFLLIYTPAAMAVGWCLCLSAHPPERQPEKYDDSCFEPALVPGLELSGALLRV
jgi:hypothetical protein